MVFFFILQAPTPSLETILRKDKTERLQSVSGLLVLKYFGVLLRYIFVVCYFHIYCFDQTVGCI